MLHLLLSTLYFSTFLTNIYLLGVSMKPPSTLMKASPSMVNAPVVESVSKNQVYVEVHRAGYEPAVVPHHHSMIMLAVAEGVTDRLEQTPVP